MQLLICTQAVDIDDPVLGFFHRWIIEFSKRFDTVHIICLKEGKHELPPNVFVHSLGKSAQGRPASGWERGWSRVRYVTKFYRYINAFRNQYDAVFVHMNSEYAVLGGMPWRLWGKRIVLWRNHKKSGLTTYLGSKFSRTVCYTSPEAYVSKFKNAVKMPIGIDTQFFTPGPERKSDSILFLGRLDPVKKVDEFIRALDVLYGRGTPFSALIVGDPTGSRLKYAHDVRNLAAHLTLDGTLSMRRAVTQNEARALFQGFAIYCNLTPSGSFDKTIGEAMASGCVVVASNAVLADVLPNELIPEGGVEHTAAALRAALAMPIAEREALTQKTRTYIEREHSLSLLVEKLFGILSS